jgi:SNF2 family DNA or RNA helicase
MDQQFIDSRMTMFNTYLDKSKLTHQQYQKDGVRWILSNELRKEKVKGGFIADEMGLGKTIMMIGTMLCNFVERTLIIVPPALIDQWYDQIVRTTGHKSLIFHGNNKKHISLSDLEAAKIVISTYGAITISNTKKIVTMLHKVSWSRIIFDEAHHLRNGNTSLYFGARLLRANIRWLVSGTPVQNRKQDFYNLCTMIRLPASYYTNPENLKDLTRAYILKRTKKEVGIILPEVILNKNMVVWKNDREKELSEELHAMLQFSNVQGRNYGLPYVIPLVALLKARQSCILPRLVSKKGGYSEYKEAFDVSSKLDSAVCKILERMGNGCGKLIFCHFREEIDEIATKLTAGGMLSVATFDGRTCNRADILVQGHEALILQIQTGCEGLNLQENYSEIYFISPHWNPAIEDQAIARCHRIGQKKVVYVERFEMCEFADQECDTTNIEKYVHFTQDGKREIVKQLCF